MLHDEIMNFFSNDIFHHKMNKNELRKFSFSILSKEKKKNLRKLLSKRAIKSDFGSLAKAWTCHENDLINCPFCAFQRLTNVWWQTSIWSLDENIFSTKFVLSKWAKQREYSYVDSRFKLFIWSIQIVTKCSNEQQKFISFDEDNL